jgi:hypothetical protein
MEELLHLLLMRLTLLLQLALELLEHQMCRHSFHRVGHRGRHDHHGHDHPYRRDRPSLDRWDELSSLLQ